MDANIAELRTHLDQLDGVLKNPQLRKAMVGLSEDIKAYVADFQEVLAFTQEAARLRDDVLVALADRTRQEDAKSPPRRGRANDARRAPRARPFRTP